MAVGAARETRMAEIARVVPRLLQRAEDERRKRLPPPPRRLGVGGDPLGGLAGERRGCLRRKLLGRRRRRDAERGELREEELDRLRVGPLVDAVERLAVPPREQLRDVLVRADHQLLDEHVRVRLAFAPRVGDAAVGEAERDLRGRDLEGAAREARLPQLPRQRVVQVELLQDRRVGLAPLRLAVREPRVGPDDGPIEGRRALRRDLDRYREAV